MSDPTKESVESVADTLHRAEQRTEPTAPVAARLAHSTTAAYAVQLLNINRRLATDQTISGRKIGLTSPAVQAQLGVNEPDFGTLTSDMMIPDGGIIKLSELIAPRIEAEIAFVFATDLDHPNMIDDPERLVQATASMHPALEVVDSRIRDWRIELADTIADNGSAARYIIGPARAPCSLDQLADVQMTLRDGTDVLSRGTGRDCLGNPIRAVQWLAHRLLAESTPIRQGDIILSGALGPMVSPQPADHIRANITSLGTVHVYAQ